MQIEKSEFNKLAETIATAVVTALEKKGLVVGSNINNTNKPEKSAYAKTEQLLYNYRGFQKIVREREAEIEDIRKYGVPKKGGVVVEYGGGGSGTVRGIVLPEETVEAAVANVERSVQSTRQAIALIDKALEGLKTDPYYCILEMRYFDGRTQEDIAVSLKCTQSTVSANKGRLVRELSMRLFPDQVVKEYLN